MNPKIRMRAFSGFSKRCAGTRSASWCLGIRVQSAFCVCSSHIFQPFDKHWRWDTSGLWNLCFCRYKGSVVSGVVYDKAHLNIRLCPCHQVSSYFLSVWYRRCDRYAWRRRYLLPLESQWRILPVRTLGQRRTRVSVFYDRERWVSEHWLSGRSPEWWCYDFYRSRFGSLHLRRRARR